MFDFLKDLDENQLSAVKYNDGPQLVIANKGVDIQNCLSS